MYGTVQLQFDSTSFISSINVQTKCDNKREVVGHFLVDPGRHVVVVYLMKTADRPVDYLLRVLAEKKVGDK